MKPFIHIPHTKYLLEDIRVSINISLPPEYRNHKEIIIKAPQYLTPRSEFSDEKYPRTFQ